MRFIELAFKVILGILVIAIWWVFGNIFYNAALTVQTWMGEVFALLVVKGLMGLSVLLFVFNFPSWISTEYRRYKWSVKKIDYWRTDFPIWLKKQKVINLFIVGIFVIYWVFFSPEGIDFILNS